MAVGLSVQVGNQIFRDQLSAKSAAIHLQVFHYPLDIVSGFPVRDAFDPVDNIDVFVARIAEFSDPAVYRTPPGIIGSDRQNVGPIEPCQKTAKIGTAQPDIV